MSDNKIVEDNPPKTEQELAQEFIKEYSELCEKHQFQIVVSPAWKARDDGTFSLIQQSSIGRLPAKEK
jgi:hypothetical protein